MAHVSTISVHSVDRIAAEFDAYNGSRWLTITFGDCDMNCYPRDDEQALRFERIADAIALVNAEFDAKAERSRALFLAKMEGRL